MRIIITADIHNGLPGKLHDCLWSMDTISNYARTNDIHTVIILGDLFHDRVNLNIETASLVYDKIKEYHTKHGQKWIVFPGNHDMFLKNSWGINTLHIFGDFMQIFEGTGQFEIGKQVFKVIPFIHYESEYMKILSKINEESSSDDILLTHVGVHGATLNECFLVKNWNTITFDDVKFKRIYTGHFHCHQQVGDKTWYPGSPIPFRFDEGVVDHGFLVYDIENETHEFINIFELSNEKDRPPKFLMIVDDDIPKYASFLDKNHVRIILSKDYTHNEMITLKDALKKRGALSVDWMLPKKEIQEITTSQLKLSEINTPENLFSSWLETDKPDLDKNVLLAAFKQIAQEAEERYVVEEDQE
jgi:DNA repair exonuclease SbcCD nuclease subunit